MKQIIGRRTRRISGKYHLEYLIRWKGFGHKGDTWEPVSNLKSCQVLVRKYERKHGKISLRNTSACKILKNAIKPKKTPNSKRVSPDSKSRTSVNVKRENGVSDECTECDSDDDLLYSLVSKPAKPKKKFEPKTVKKVPKATSKNCETNASSKVPLTVLASKTTTPCTTKKKGMKRMKLLDSVKKNESKAGKIDIYFLFVCFSVL